MRYIVCRIDSTVKYRVDAATYEIDRGAHIFRKDKYDYPFAVYPLEHFYVKREV